MNLSAIYARRILRETKESAAAMAFAEESPHNAFLQEDLMLSVNHFRLHGDVESANKVDDKSAHLVSTYGVHALPLDKVSVQELSAIAAHADEGRDHA